MKTIFLVVNQGFSARYLLRSGFFDTLSEARIRIVILTPSGREKYFKEEFAGENLSVEYYDMESYVDNFFSRLHQFFGLMRIYSFQHPFKNNFTEYWREHYFDSRRSKGLIKKILDGVLRISIKLNSRYKMCRRAFMYLEAKTTPKIHSYLFKKYKPDLTVVTSLGMLPSDHYIMNEAASFKSKVVSLILSWDNTTTKGTAGAVADHVVAWTDTMKTELEKFHSIPLEKIFVGGVAQYDTYFSSSWDKKEIVLKYNLKKEAKKILYCLESPTAYRWNIKLIEKMASLISAGKIGREVQLIVRLHPIYYRIKNGKFIHKDEIQALKDLQVRFPFIIINYPEILSQNMSFDMPRKETITLAELLFVSDLVICFYSSLMIEASIMDKPIINISIYHKDNLPNEVMGNHAHNTRVLSTGAVQMVYDEESLIKAINTYLQNPEKDKEARKEVVKNEAGPNRGFAGEAIAANVLSLLDA